MVDSQAAPARPLPEYARYANMGRPTLPQGNLQDGRRKLH